MTPVDTSLYYNLGHTISELRAWMNCFLKNPQSGVYREAGTVISRLKSILFIIESEEITEGDKELKSALAGWIIKYADDLNKVFGIEDTKTLNGLLTRLDAVLRNDLKYFTAYSFEHDSNLNIIKLEEEGAKGMYSEVVWNQLSEITRRDLEESAKCLLYSLPTASGILALRGMEEMVRQYLNVIDKTGVSKGSHPKTWGEILGLLEKLQVNSSILGQLKYLKDGIRNPLSHPEMCLTIDEAESVFFVVKNSIIMILKELDKHK